MYFKGKDPSSIYDTVMERYVGRQPELVRAEAAIDKLRVKIKDGTFSLLSRGSNTHTIEEINNSPENKEIVKELKKLFQLKDLDLYWFSNPIPNAMTFCKSAMFLDKDYKVDGRGVDYNKKLSVHVMVHTGLITSLDMTAEELLAIILHEIGHNFYNSIIHTLTQLSPFTVIKNTLAANTASLITAFLTDKTNYRKFLLKIFYWFNTLPDKLHIRQLTTLYQEIMLVVGSLTPRSLRSICGYLVGKLKLNLNGVDPIANVMTYSTEKHADSFAVDYGYGKALASGINKLEQRENSALFNIPIVGWVYDLDGLAYDIFFQSFSGYPSDHNRKHSALKRLKEAQKDPDLPPRLRKELAKQIEEFEEYYEELMSLDNDENKKRIFTWSYRWTVDKLFGGNVDIRELMYKFDSTNPKKDTWGKVNDKK